MYVHNLDPFAITLNWNILGFHIDGIRWYGLAYLTAFVLGYVSIHYMAVKKLTPLTVERASDFVTYVAIGVLVGGRVGYAVFYSPDLLTDFSGGFPFWGLLKVYNGGMASHGGIIGVLIACWLFSRKQKISIWHLADLTCMAGALGFMFGRIANFINGELYGRPCSPHFRWAMKFPQEMYRWASNAFVDGTGAVREHAIEKLKTLGPVVEKLSPIHLHAGGLLSADNSTWSSWVTSMTGYSENKVYQFIQYTIGQIQHHNQHVTTLIAPLLTPRYPSELFQSFMEGFLVFVILMMIWLKPRKPGVITAWFGILYAFMRILGEQFRMPDVQIGFEIFGLTRGQILSIVMLLTSAVLLIYCLRRSAPKYGGWLSVKSSDE